ncbi:MAG: hypothetical protein DCC65_01945 [Planctomycetota bacterium]|nr:MAG: hypothetical protein DCC65_01945 [Planctomycetota bacterium]
MRSSLGHLLPAAGLLILIPHMFSGCGVVQTDVPFAALEFPLGNTAVVDRIAAFGVPNWSGVQPHNGIDLVVSDSLASSPVVSPAAGTVRRISLNENSFSNPVGQFILTVELRVNAEWTVSLVLEPGTVDPDLRAAQRAAVHVAEGDVVAVGSPVAELLVGSLGYAHLHYMVHRNGHAVCAYAHSSDAARAIFDTLADRSGSHVPDGRVCYAPQ